MVDVDVSCDPISINTSPISLNTGPVSVALTGLDDIKADGTFKLDGNVDSRLTTRLELPDPIRSEARAAIDLQPVAFDHCMRISLGPLPSTLFSFPNRQHIGITLFGLEIFGITLSGEARIAVGKGPRDNAVIAASPRPPPRAGPTRIRLGG
jgi:hypothetical protein